MSALAASVNSSVIFWLSSRLARRRSWISTIFFRSSSFSRSKMMISSTRFRNSGRKWLRNASSTSALALFARRFSR